MLSREEGNFERRVVVNKRFRCEIYRDSYTSVGPIAAYRTGDSGGWSRAGSKLNSIVITGKKDGGLTTVLEAR